MPLKPVDKRNPNRDREGMWRAMMDRDTFTIKDIGRATLINTGTISAYLIGLIKAGFVELKVEPAKRNQIRNHYKVVKKSLTAPRVRKDGTEVEQGRATENMWRSIKMMKSFTALDLAANATTDKVIVPLTTAKDYLKYLNKAGYLRVLRPSKPGTKAIYCKVADRKKYGAKPLQIQRVKQVYDPNIHKVVWPLEDDQ